MVGFRLLSSSSKLAILLHIAISPLLSCEAFPATTYFHNIAHPHSLPTTSIRLSPPRIKYATTQHKTIPSSSTSTSLFAKSGTKKKKAKDGTITINRLAYRNYEIVDTLEVGIALLGTEVKSIRDGKMNIRDGYIRPTTNKRGCTLHNVHIGKHSQSSEYFNHEETRVRNLLLHRNEARKFSQQVERQGMTIVPLKAYFNDRNQVKLQIALCRGKNVRDKRASIKEREAKRDTDRIVKNFRV